MRKLKKNFKVLNNKKKLKALNYLENNFFNRKSKRKGEKNIKENFIVPTIFSLIDNPDESIKFIKSLFFFRYSSQNDILLDISKCTVVDMCALFLLEYVLLLIIYEKNKKGNIIYTLSEHNEINKMFIDASIGSYFKDTEEFKVIRNKLKKIPLKLLKTIYGSDGKDENDLMKYLLSSDKIKTIVGFEQTLKEYFDDYLENEKLNYIGERNIQKIISEWKSNCENHLRKFCEFYFKGSILKNKNNKEICNIVLVNFGETIIESYNSSNSKIAKKTFNDLIENYNYNIKFKKENAVVLAAIQNKVSILKNENNVRGTGFNEIMKYFYELSSEQKDSKITIISGNTQIVFSTEEYKKYFKDGYIFFNDENTNKKLPNNKNVKCLENYFPGTLISFKFYFKEQHLGNIKT